MPCYLGWSSILEWMSLTMHFHWKKPKCLCRFLDSMAKSQSRISKKDSHMAEGKMPIPKQFQNRNWQAEVRMVCNGEHCLHWLKLVCLWIYVHLYFENIFPLQKSCLRSLLDGKMELKTWETCIPIKKNVCCGIPYGHRSAPVLHLLRGGVTGEVYWHGSNFNF